MHSSEHTSIQGFTLLEITVSVAIFLLLSAFSIPIGRSAVDHMKLKTTGNNIKNAIKVAQSKALADPQIHCGVYLFPGTGSSEAYAGKEYGVFFDINGNYLYDDNTDEIFMSTHSIPKGIQLSIPENTGITDNVIIFRGDGSAKFGGSIILTSSLDRINTINVLASTGRVKTIME